MDTLALRPLGIPEVIDAAIKLVTRNARTMFTISALALIPVGILNFLLVQPLEGLFISIDPNNPPTDPEELLPAVLGALGAAFLTAVFGLLAQLVVQLGSVKAIGDVYLDRVPAWRESLLYGLRKLPVAMVMGILAVLGIVVGFLFCFIPGIWLATSWAVAIPSLVVEETGPAEGLGRSFQLVRKRFWPVLGTLALTGLVLLVIGLVEAPIVAALTAGDEVFPLGLQVLVDTAFNIVVVPFTAAVVAVLYFDLRVRQEGFDLERLAAALGTSPPSPPSPPPPPSSPGLLPPAPPDNPSDPFGLGDPGGS